MRHTHEGRSRPYRICTRCIMDTSDPDISFNSDGVCCHCLSVEQLGRKRWKPDDSGSAELRAVIGEITRERRNQEYDCILGISGGLDSCYVLAKAVQFGLRPLVLHVDTGWNSELAVQNIELLLRKLHAPLMTYVVNWPEMQDLQLAYLKAGVHNQDVPQDHAIFAQLLKTAAARGIRCVLTGSNFASESILPRAWGYRALDGRNLRAIHRAHGTRPLHTFPIVSYWGWSLYFPYVKGIRYVRPLNYLPYDRANAREELARDYGWRDYGGKHYESRFTKFFQGSYLPRRYGIDKRRAHLSSLIASGQVSRAQALAQVESPPYPVDELAEDTFFVCKKLGITLSELEAFINLPRAHARDFPSDEALFDAEERIRSRLGATKQRMVGLIRSSIRAGRGDTLNRAS